MIIEDKQWQECPTCHRKNLLRDYVYGCDNCGKEIDLNFQDEYLLATNFHHDGEHQDLIFCSWQCFFAKLRALRIDCFLKMPYLSADISAEGLTIRNFWQAVKSCQMP
jgi:hypothetical protein